MKLLFLGTGSAFTLGENFQSNLLMINAQDEKLLIDCGGDVRHALFEHGYKYTDIEHVYISHLHADHIGGLEWLGFSRKFDVRLSLANLYLSSDLVDDLWEHSLCGGMRSLRESPSELSSFFKVHPIDSESKTFKWSGVQFRLVQTEHVFDNGVQVPCYGLFFECDNKKIFFTSDAQFTPELFANEFTQADIIFHDCEISLNRSGVHAHYEELRQLPREIKQKMWLYHYQPLELPDAKAAGFQGFIRPGQVFDFSAL